MTPEFKVTLDIAQVVLLGGLIWGLARMSKAVDVLSEVTDTLTKELKVITGRLMDMGGRVRVLEDRTRR